MTETFLIFMGTLLDTVSDVLPIAAIIFGFQFFVIRKRIPNLKRVSSFLLYVNLYRMCGKYCLVSLMF